MRFLNVGVVGICLFGACAAHAANEAELIFSNGSSKTTDQFTIQAGQVVYGREKTAVPFSQIKSVNYTFEDDLTQAEFNVFLRLGSYDELIASVDALLDPVKDGLSISGNIDQYIQYKMRACFWAGKYEEARAQAELLQSKNSAYAPLASAYLILIQLEEGVSVTQLASAYEQDASVASLSKAMNEYVLGCFALGEKNYDDALQRFSNVLVFYSRDPEWVPAATFNEGLIYKKTGFLDAASSVVEELKIAYPDSHWGVRADELNN